MFTSHSPCGIHEDIETTFYRPTFQPSRQTIVLEKLAHGTRSAIRQLSGFNSKTIRTIFTSKALVNRIYLKKARRQGRREEVWEAESVG